ncbi:MAG: exodeoxyribonuclease VII large subunit [Alphaproteobacteria bacterium]
MTMAEAPITNIPEYTVGELSVALRQTVEATFGRVRVRGEISGFKRHTSGHLYFALKDQIGKAVLDAACFRNIAQRLAVRPEEGLEVVVTGRVTTYADRSKYQIIVEAIEAAGVGAWLALLEQRRKALAAEGLFDEARKRPLPFLPEVVGVVTSPTGAVIRDILHRLADRFPRRVLVWPVLVQGEGAPEQVAAAIAGFNALPPDGPVPRPDVLIVARGGGSIEDLWAFNEEIVVRAAAASDIPLIAAIGHETDVTLIDFAADRRAPTPTAAAEIAVPVRAELVARTLDLGGRLVGGLQRGLEARRSGLAGLARAMRDPTRLIEERSQRLDGTAQSLRRVVTLFLGRRERSVVTLGGRLRHPREIVAAKRAALATAAGALRPRDLLRDVARHRRDVARLGDRLHEASTRRVAEARERLAHGARLLDGLGYRQVLARGFVLTRDDAGAPVTSAAQAVPGKTLTLTYHDGERRATVAGAAKPAETQRAKGARSDQGTLL